RASLDEKGENGEQNFSHTKNRQCIWEAEGRESSVAITATDSLAFIVNGKSDGNAFGDAGTQIGLGLIGPLLHPAPRTGLVIGLGTGESAGWMSAVEEMTAVDVVELEPVVLEMTQRCSQINRDALNNPKLKLHFNDAREFLLTSKKQYDLIVSEPSNPYRAGIANLYTREFYDSVSQRLNPEGLFLQWLQGYEVDDSTVHIVLQTVRSTFPEVQIWQTKARDMVLVCGKSKQAFQYQWDSLQQKLKQPVMAEGLKQGWSVIDVEGILAHFVCGNRTIDQLLESLSDPMNLDDRNLLEYAFAKTVGKSTRFSIHDLQDRAVQLNDDLPVTLDDESREKVIQRRLAMQLRLGGAVYIADSLSEAQQTRGEAYNLYLARRYLDVLARFQTFEPDFSCPIETLVHAHTLAESGVPVPEEQLVKIREHNPTEATAIEAIAALQQKQPDQGLQNIINTLKLLQDSPWGSRQLLDAILFKSVSLCDASAAYAAPLYAQLQRPFALHRLEDNRLLVRYLIAEKMENQQIIDSLATMEPNVPWKEWLLEKRVRVYSAVKHPLTEQARSELSQFKRANH
ncbi:MAG: fused MFS/spermidine synthase, partial [Planctomycetaceae bacterium]|nr:fused MFS/spermidine synthase [Planctomycetaceae bacterium]